LGAEVVEAGGEVGEALLAALGGEAAFLERVKVPGGGVFGAMYARPQCPQRTTPESRKSERLPRRREASSPRSVRIACD